MAAVEAGVRSNKEVPPSAWAMYIIIVDRKPSSILTNEGYIK
jgi:hypothetical protein